MLSNTMRDQVSKVPGRYYESFIGLASGIQGSDRSVRVEDRER